MDAPSNSMREWLEVKQNAAEGQTFKSRPKTSGYQSMRYQYWQQPRDLPPFSFAMIYFMLIDPQVRLCLNIRSAPLFGTEFAWKKSDPMSPRGYKWIPGIQARRPEVAKFVERQLTRIWHNHLSDIVEAQKYGWSAGEVCLKLGSSRMVEVSRIEPRKAADVRLLLTDGVPSGVEFSRIKNRKGDNKVNLAFPDCFFHSHDKQPGEEYGTSVLLGAYSPWADKWLDGGALDVRRLFMLKDAYSGADLGYPEGETYLDDLDTPVPNRDIARQIVEQIRSGGVTTRPSERDDKGNEKWPLTRATVSGNPAHILQYPKDCDDEIRQGIGIPDGVIDDTGAGAWAGKRIPMSAFYASLDTWIIQIINDLTEQIFEPLILLNFGSAEDFQITHKPLAEQAMEQQSNAGGGQPEAQQQQPGGFPGMPQMPQQAGNGQGSNMYGVNNDSGQGQIPQPARMGLEAVGQSVLSAAEMVKAARDVIRMSADASDDEPDPIEQATLIAEVLTHIYGDDAEAKFDEIFGDAPPQRMATWNPIDHPRGPDGRFIERNSPEAVAAAHAKIKEALSGKRTSKTLEQVTENLSILTVGQLKDIREKYGIQAGGARPSLIAKIADRLHGIPIDDADAENEAESDDTKPGAEAVGLARKARQLESGAFEAGDGFGDAIDAHEAAADAFEAAGDDRGARFHRSKADHLRSLGGDDSEEAEPVDSEAGTDTDTDTDTDEESSEDEARDLQAEAEEQRATETAIAAMGNTSGVNAYDQATKAGADPREAAEVAADQPSEATEYEFARESSIGNAGEDLKHSARHKVNAWRGLDDAESDGTAEKMVTRDMLFKLEPHELMTHADANPVSAVAMHFALKAFPPKPKTGKRGDAAKDRREYLNAYRSVKERAEQLAKSTPDNDAIGAMSQLQEHVKGLITSLREQKVDNEYGNQVTDRYNQTANDLVPLYRSLQTRYNRSKTSAYAKFNNFVNSAMEQHGEALSTTDAKDRVDEFASLVKSQAKDVIEGKSVNSVFGKGGNGERGEQRKRFNASEAYVDHATREGGRDLSKVTSDPNKATAELVDGFGLRGVQWGNSVTDGERKHHAARAVEALADLSDVLGIKPEDISIDGKLGLAIGARGHGSASAHYEPSTQVINLTRKSGVGALAHEWGHAFDHHLTEFNGYMSEGFRNTHRITKDNRSFEVGGDVTKWNEDWERTELPNQEVRAAYAELNEGLKPFRRRLGGVLGKMVREGQMSAKKANDYWASGREVFARAFETYIGHRLESDGRKNTYLAGLADGQGDDSLWPTKEESEALAPAFEAIMAAYRTDKYGDSAPVKMSLEQRRKVIGSMAEGETDG